MSTAIDGRDAFGRQIHQAPAPTLLLGRERIAIRRADGRGIALHRSGNIVATFNGKSTAPQTGTGWTLITPDGMVHDRTGSTLGGLFLLPLGFMGERAVAGGGVLHVGDTWTDKLGVALFGMTARPLLDYRVTGTREVFGATVYELDASGTAPVAEPIVTNDGVALGVAHGTSRVTLHCDYDPHLMRAVSMEIDIADDLTIGTHARGPSGTVSDRQHYLVALDAASVHAESVPAPGAPSAPTPAAAGTPGPGVTPPPE